MEKNKLSVWQSACIITGYGVGAGFGIPWLINDKKQRKEDDLRL